LTLPKSWTVRPEGLAASRSIAGSVVIKNEPDNDDKAIERSLYLRPSPTFHRCALTRTVKPSPLRIRIDDVISTLDEIPRAKKT
jgi:hypothetical protein